jgi:alkanesulfonate monooxygenase SsuD/methylene tetrahydromethanopterin reductase-like flavin-dependent oxidoreductase (luciferase family)
MTDTKTSDPGGPGGTSAIGSTGVWIRTDAMTARETAELSRRVEALGYGAFWFPEIRGRNAFVQASWLLAATERLHVATGIANIFLREPYATATAQRTLAEQSEGRFVLGLGISHAPFVEHVLGRRYQSPVSDLDGYLDRMEGIAYDAPEPKTPAPIVLAALGPRLLRLAARRTAGSHSYLYRPSTPRGRARPSGPIPGSASSRKRSLSASLRRRGGWRARHAPSTWDSRTTRRACDASASGTTTSRSADRCARRLGR